MLDASLYLNKMLAERYHIVKEIGHGASSVVFYAEDMMTKREDGSAMPVALKILDKDSGEYKLNSRSFQTETRAVVDMPTNAHTVAVQDVSYDYETGVHFIVMEYVKGSTLRRYISSRGTLSAKEIVSVSLQVLQALRNAHESGVVHRDVKPQNILVQSPEEAGNVTVPGGKDMPYIKLADFGIALLPDEDMFAIADRGVGTVHYISPEQAGGGTIDARSDLYSLGVVMYEMATGRVPFDAESPNAIITRHQTDAPTHARTFNPSVPLSLDRIIFTAMQKDPHDRFKDAVTMERRLMEVLRELEGGARNNIEISTLPRKEQVVPVRTQKPVKLPREPKTVQEPKATKVQEPKMPKFTKPVEPVLRQETQKPVQEPTAVRSEMPKPEKHVEPKEKEAPKVPKEPKVPKAPKAPKVSKEKKERRPIPRQVFFIGGGAGLGAVVLIAAALLMIPLFKGLFAGDTVLTVPKLEGTMYSDSNVYQEGITVVVSAYEYHDTVQEGYIISQSEGAGKEVLNSITIFVVVSKGPAVMDFELPDKHRVNYQIAQTYIEETYKDVRVSTRYEIAEYDAAKGDAGEVIGVKYLLDGKEVPLNGGQILVSTEITLVINGNKTIEFVLPEEARDSYLDARNYVAENYGDFISTSPKNVPTSDPNVPSGAVYGAQLADGTVVSIDGGVIVANTKASIVLLCNQ